MKILKSLKKEKSDDSTNKISHMYDITYRIAVILTEQVICKEEAYREDVALPKNSRLSIIVARKKKFSKSLNIIDRLTEKINYILEKNLHKNSHISILATVAGSRTDGQTGIRIKE